MARLEKINLFALHTFLKKQATFQHAFTVKLIHGWIPSYAGCTPSPLCPWCKGTSETPDHVYVCPTPLATLHRAALLEQYLSNKIKANTPTHITGVFDIKLSSLLEVPCKGRYKLPLNVSKTNYQTILDATWHQNILGWHLFLKGYISDYWRIAYWQSHGTHSSSTDHLWAINLVSATIGMYKAIWADGDTHIHGTNWLEAQKLLRDRLIRRVPLIYAHPPKMDKPFQRVQKMPLQDHVWRSNLYLQRWLSRIEHQERVTKLILQTMPPNQPTIVEAFKRIKHQQKDSFKYPPWNVCVIQVTSTRVYPLLTTFSSWGWC